MAYANDFESKNDLTRFELQAVSKLLPDDFFRSNVGIYDGFTVFSYDLIENIVLSDENVFINRRKIRKRDVNYVMGSIYPSIENPFNFDTTLCSTDKSRLNNYKFPKTSRIPYLLKYIHTFADCVNSFDKDKLAILIKDIFCPDSTFMTPNANFVNAITSLPLILTSIMLCIPDFVFRVSSCEVIHPRIIQCRINTSGTFVGTDENETLWNQYKYLSCFTNESVQQAKYTLEHSKRNGHVAVYTDIINVLLILNEEGTHIVQQMHFILHSEVTSTISKHIYLENDVSV